MGKPVTVRIKDPVEPSAPPRKTQQHHHKDQADRKIAQDHQHQHHYLGAKEAENKKTTPSLNPTVPHFIESQKQSSDKLDNQKFATKVLDNRVAPLPAEPQQVLDNGHTVRRNVDNGHSVRRNASFNDKSRLDNRQGRVSVWETSSNNLNQLTRPGDVLRTPYLSSSSRALNQHGSSQNVVGNFPHIPGNSMVAKTKALFEGSSGGPTSLLLSQSRAPSPPSPRTGASRAPAPR